MNTIKTLAQRSICLLALLILCAVPRAAAASFAGGSGTKIDPYQIATAAQLNSVRSNLSAHYKLTADITFTEEDFASGGAYYNSGAGWSPIGTASAPFKGTFDGGGHSITGLYQNIIKEVSSSSEEKYVLGGLFGYFGNYSGSISNLNVLDCDIYIENTITSGIAYANAGAVVGYSHGGTVENCHSSGSVIAEADYSNAGGIVGDGNSVIGCSNTAYVSGNFTGGIAGEAYTISQCYNAGLIAGRHAGGIVGQGSMVTVKNCYNTGTITGVASMTSNAGGIAGQGGKLMNCYNAGNGCGYAFVGRSESSTVLTNCYYLNCYDSGLYSTTVEDTAVSCSADELTDQDTFEGFDFDTVWTFEAGTNYKLPVLRGVTHIEPKNNTTDFAGGNGKPYNPYLISNTTQLDNVRDHRIASYKLTRDIIFTADDFSADGAFHNDGIGWQPIGTVNSPYIGVFDGNGKTIRGLTITGNTSTVYYGLFSHISSSLIHDLHLTDASIDIYLSSQAYVGGIAADADINEEDSRIVNCSFDGNITCDKMKPYNGWLYIGGITGRNGKITNCRNDADIRCTLTSPRPYIGGISGSGARITDCVNTGDITFSATSATLYIGGIIGQASTGSVRRCWNSGDITATVTTGTAYCGGILGTTLSYTNGYCYDCYNTGAVSGTYAGGIAGGVRGTIGTCYNIGAATGTNAGGIAGKMFNTTTVTDCYFAADTAASGWGDGTVCGTFCQRTAMQSADTFTGFDFNTIWTMDGNADYLYPELQTVDMVFEKTLLRIELTALPDKTDYLEGEPFDSTGMIVTAYYDNDTSAAVEPEISCDTSTAGTQTVTLTYKGETLTFEITVQEDPLPGLAAQIVFTYDEATRTAALTDVPESVCTVLAGYAEDKMLFAELWDTAGTLTYTLPEDCTPDSLLAYILTADWRPITEPLSPTRKPAADSDLIDVSGETARTAVLAEGTLELAAQLPGAAWNSLPDWNGVTVPNLQEYGFEYDGQPQVFAKEDMENISDLGFNFVRVPLDTRIFLDRDDPGMVHSEKLENLDELISWGAEFGTHVCVDVHSSFGFTTDGDNTNDTIWEDSEEQEIFLTFWDLLAERYQEVPSNLLSFNLMNEPNWGLEEEVYADLMRRAMERIRTHTPNRLIFVDMLNTAQNPVYSLAEDKAAQSFHFYEPDALTHAGVRNDFGGAYPVFTGKGFLSKGYGSGDFVIEGDFPAGTTVRFFVDEIHKGGTLCLTADGTAIFSEEYGFDAVGENGCIYIEEAGTEGEYRGYNAVFTAELPEDASVLRLYVEGDTYWFNLNRLQISAGDQRYLFEQNLDPLPEGIDIHEIPNPHIIIGENGTITDAEDILFGIVDASYLSDRFAAYKAFSEETGVAVMMQEFGVYYAAPYDLTLEYLDDLLDAANANGLNWCGWDYFGPFSFYQVSENTLREGAVYEEFSNGWIAAEMLEVYQNHLTQ